MLDSDNKKTLNILKKKLEDFSKESKVVNGMFEKKYHTDYYFSIREDKRNNKEIHKEELKEQIAGHIKKVSNLEDQKYLAGAYLFEIMKLSQGDDETVKNRFFVDGLEVISSIAESFPLTEQTRDKVVKYIAKNKGTIKKNKANTTVSMKALKMLEAKKYVNPIEGVDMDNVVARAQTVRDYTKYVCKCAADYNKTSIGVDGILDLLKKNTSLNGMDVIQPTLFEEGKKIKAINKKMVLDVAEIYAKSINSDSVALGLNNKDFDKNMETMFTHIVTDYGYNREDVKELGDILIGNSSDKKYVEKMVDNIEKAYDQKYPSNEKDVNNKKDNTSKIVHYIRSGKKR